MTSSTLIFQFQTYEIPLQKTGNGHPYYTTGDLGHSLFSFVCQAKTRKNERKNNGRSNTKEQKRKRRRAVFNIKICYTFQQPAEFDWNSKLQGKIHGLYF